MIVWLNGPFGGGKSTTAGLLREQAGWRTFDPEHVGYLLAGNLRDLEFDDFQDLPPWRSLVPTVLGQVHRHTGSPVTVASQTVLVERYWDELRAGLAREGLPVVHVVLDCDDEVLRSRIAADEDDPEAAEWRLAHVARFGDARTWLHSAADLTVDTSITPATGVAARIVEAVTAAAGEAGRRAENPQRGPHRRLRLRSTR